MNDSECRKALTLLIHDLRAPLSVAQGYLRLLKDQRLESADERARAMDQATASLGRISRLCADAAAFTDEEPADRMPSTGVPTGRFIDQVAQECAARKVASLVFEVAVSDAHGHVRSAHPERLVHSVATILFAAHRGSTDAPVRVEPAEEGREVRFLLGDSEARARLTRAHDPFDAWRGGHGLALPLACRAVAAAGGRIWSALDARGAVAIALPQEYP